MAADGIGVLTFTELPSTRRWSSTNGWTVLRKWNGHKDNLDNFLNNLMPDGALEYEVSIEGKIATITANYGASSPTDTGGAGSQLPDPITEQWSLSGQMVEVSLWEHPDVLNQFQRLNPTQRADLVKLINDGIENDTPGNTMGWPAIVSNSDLRLEYTGMSPFWSLYERLKVGVTSMPRSQQTLRKTLTIGSYSQLKASHTNVNHILTYAQLIQSEPNWQVAFLVNAAGLNKYVWLKQAPTADPVERGTWQLTQEYLAFKKYDGWVHLDYGMPERDTFKFFLTPT